MTIQESLKNWAKDAVDVFNPLSQTTSTQFYLQSPLDQITAPVDTLVLGINPHGEISKGAEKSPEEFLKGNPKWDRRFEGNHVSREWSNYFGKAHKMICGNQERDHLMLDNDKKTVWENLTPFVTPDSGQLKPEHWDAGLRSTADLITILKPKRIILLSESGFNRLAPYIAIEHLPIVKDTITQRTIEIGTIGGYPAIQLSHPSREWITHSLFLPMIVQLHKLHAVDEKIEPLEEAATKIKNQLRRIEVI